LDEKLVLNKNLIHFFKVEVPRDDAIKKLASLLNLNGFVKETFSKAVIDREKVFPTGLPTKPVGIAIPHTDAEHVNNGAMAVGILKSPVEFIEMGTVDTSVKVSIISMLAISNPDTLIKVLMKLAGSFQDEQFLMGLSTAKSAEKVLELYRKVIPDVVDFD
jgi:PTS system galactitol-specific IIA component